MRHGPESLGRFRLEREIGRGAMGVVYLAEDPEAHRRVALKAFRAHPGISQEHVEELRQRFINEARSASSLSHPNIVNVYDAGVEDDVLFLAMEYVEGESLEQVIDSERVLDLDQVADLALKLGAALDHAHEQGVVHRDVRPANVILDERGQPRIADFGVARQATATLTAAGTVTGPPAYTSPEEITAHPITGASDQFSLGALLYELLTGRQPFRGDDATTVLYGVLHEEPEAPTAIRTSLPADVDAVILRALSKESSERHATCTRLAEELRGALGLAIPDAARVERTAVAAGAASAVDGEIGIDGAGDVDPPASSGASAAALPLNAPTLLSAVAAVVLVALGLVWVLGDWEEESAPLTPEIGPTMAVPDIRSTEPVQRFPATETFRITSRPAGAQVMVDGRVLAERTPVEVALDPSARHTLLLELSGRESVSWAFVPEELPEEQRRTGRLYFPLRETAAVTATTAAPAPATVAETGDRDEPRALQGRRIIEPFEPYDPVEWRRSRDTGPTVVERVEPELPGWAAEAGLRRYVVLETIIDRRGRVREARRHRDQPVHPELERLAQEAIFGWRFTPALRDGDADQPIDVYHNVTVAFRLPDNSGGRAE